MTDEQPIKISCQEVWREISNYIEGDLDAGLRARMQEHFKACAHCTAILDGAHNLIRLVGDDRSFQPPEGFSRRLRQRILRHVGKK